MDICNCQKDLHAYFCDIPFGWRKGLIDALCLLMEEDKLDCKNIKVCETLTELSTPILIGNILFIDYINEHGQVSTSSVNLKPVIDSLLNDVNPKCLMSQIVWNTLSIEDKIQAIINSNCTCCTPLTTTTSTTTTTTILNYLYCVGYDEIDCELACTDYEDCLTTTTTTTEGTTTTTTEIPTTTTTTEGTTTTTTTEIPTTTTTTTEGTTTTTTTEGTTTTTTTEEPTTTTTTTTEGTTTTTTTGDTTSTTSTTTVLSFSYCTGYDEIDCELACTDYVTCI